MINKLISPLSQVPKFNLENQGGFDLRTELNMINAALLSANSGSLEPKSPPVGMFWLNTSTTTFKLTRRNTAGLWPLIFDTENPPSKSDVTLGNVPNWPKTDEVTDPSTAKLISAKATNTIHTIKLDKLGVAYDSERLGTKPANDWAFNIGDYQSLRAQETTKDDVNLENVSNRGITDSLIQDAPFYASSKAVSDLNKSKLNKTGKANDTDKLDGLHAADLALKIHAHPIDHATNGIVGLKSALAGKLGKSENAASSTTADKWRAARSITLTGESTGAASLDGSGNVALNISAKSAISSGTANKLKTARTISINGEVSGTEIFDGSKDISLETKINIPLFSMPVGSSLMYAGSTIPAGWLEMTGQTIQREQYPDLVTAIAGSGAASAVVPDMRGEFPRGFDNGRGVDSGRAINSAQEQSYQSHKHTGKTENHSHSYARFLEFQTVGTNVNWGPVRTVPTNGWSVYGGTGNSSGGRVAIRMRNITTNSSSVAPALVVDNSGTEETRSRNVALMFIIRAT